MSQPEIIRPQPLRNSRYAIRILSATLVLAGLTLLAPIALQAQSVPEIEAEIARLQKLLEQSKQANTKENASGVTAANTKPSAPIQEEPSEKSVTPAVEPAPRTNAPVVLDAVIVTAEESIKEVPKSIGIVSGVELDTFHVNNFRDIVDRVGNVRTTWQNPQTTSIILRGVGWAAGSGVLDPSVGVEVDGVSFGVTGIAALSNFTDIDSAKVVRGPQGIDGGRQTSVGRISINTTAPSFVPQASGELILGQLSHVTETVAFGGPIVDNLLAYRISLNRETQEGPFTNKLDPANTYRNTDRTSARVQLLLTPNKDLEAKLSVNFTPRGKEMCENCFTYNVPTPAYFDNLDANGQPLAFAASSSYATSPAVKLQRRWFTNNTNVTSADFFSQTQVARLSDYPNTYETKGAALNVTEKLNSNLTLTSITAYQDFHYRQGRGSLSAFNWNLAPQGTETDYWQFSQELKLDWDISSSLKSQTGFLYYQRSFPLIGQLTRYGPDAGAWNANAAQYQTLDPLVPTVDSATGYVLLKNSADGLVTHTRSKLDSRSPALYSNLVWQVNPKLSITAGARVTREFRQASGSNAIDAQGYAPELNPVSSGNVQLNGFANAANGNLSAGNSAEQLALADFVAQKYFAAANYAALTATQKAQVAASKAIRAARIGTLYSQTTAQGYKATLPTLQLGSTYKLSESQSIFASWSHGTKAGVSQISGGTVLGGKSVPAGTETSNSYDLGLKSLYLDKKLVVDGTFFLQDIHNYIQNGVVFDPVQTLLNNNGLNAYQSALVNVPKVRTKGLELSASYTGIPHTTLRISGAYTDARYESFPTAANPWELSGDGRTYTDVTGYTLPGAPKYSGNVYANYAYPLGSKLVHANVNYNYTSRYYSDPTLSRYLVADAVGLTDINVGLGRRDGKFDVSILVKNLFDVEAGVRYADVTPQTYKPGIPRWVGVVFKAAY